MSVFSAITPKGCESKAQNLGELLIQSAGGACDMAVRGVESAFSAIAHYGPGLAGSTLGAANDLVSGVNDAVRGLGIEVSGIAAPKAAADNSPFAGIDLGGIGLGWNQYQQAAPADQSEFLGVQASLPGAGHSRGTGWSLAA